MCVMDAADLGHLSRFCYFDDDDNDAKVHNI